MDKNEMSNFKVGDTVRTKKEDQICNKNCQKIKPIYDKCKECGMFNGESAKVLAVREHEVYIELSFVAKCVTLRSGQVWWPKAALEKAYKWIRIK